MVQLISLEKTKEFSQNAVSYCEALEAGNILFFPSIPFSFPQEDIDFLLKQKQASTKRRKNISFKPHLGKVSNYESLSSKDGEKLKQVMQSFSHQVSSFLAELLAPYAPFWKIDYASFRPFQEKGRKLRRKARNDLLHLDAFPSRPMYGDRILRFFININPSVSRKWITSASFAELATHFLKEKKVAAPRSTYQVSNRMYIFFIRFLQKLGLPFVCRSPYDRFMLRFHHFLKQEETFQKKGNHKHWDFPPGSCWMVFTDQVSHAALEGQYALEQTFLVPRDALLNPEKAPISILEHLTGEVLSEKRS